MHHTNRIHQYLDQADSMTGATDQAPISTPAHTDVRDVERAAAELHDMLEAFADVIEDAENEMGAFVLDLLADDLAELAGVLADAEPELIEAVDPDSLRITKYTPPAGTTVRELEEVMDVLDSRGEAEDISAGAQGPRSVESPRGFFRRISRLG